MINNKKLASVLTMSAIFLTTPEPVFSSQKNTEILDLENKIQKIEEYRKLNQNNIISNSGQMESKLFFGDVFISNFSVQYPYDLKGSKYTLTPSNYKKDLNWATPTFDGCLVTLGTTYQKSTKITYHQAQFFEGSKTTTQIRENHSFNLTSKNTTFLTKQTKDDFTLIINANFPTKNDPVTKLYTMTFEKEKINQGKQIAQSYQNLSKSCKSDEKFNLFEKLEKLKYK